MHFIHQPMLTPFTYTIPHSFFNTNVMDRWIKFKMKTSRCINSQNILQLVLFLIYARQKKSCAAYFFSWLAIANSFFVFVYNLVARSFHSLIILKCLSQLYSNKASQPATRHDSFHVQVATCSLDWLKFISAWCIYYCCVIVIVYYATEIFCRWKRDGKTVRMYAYTILLFHSLRSMKICCMQTSGFFHVQTCTLFHLHFNHIKQHELDLLQFSWQQNQYG